MHFSSGGPQGSERLVISVVSIFGTYTSGNLNVKIQDGRPGEL